MCVCVCLSAIIPSELHVRSSPDFLCVLPPRSSSDGVVIRICTSGFVDDVIFAHKPRLLDVAAQLKRSAHAALGLAINCALLSVAGQRTYGTTFRALRVTSQVATPGMESAVCDCLVVEILQPSRATCCSSVNGAESQSLTITPVIICSSHYC